MKKTTVNKYLGSYTVSSSSGGTGGAVNSVNGKTGDVVLTKTDLGLGNVDNTSDMNKPVSTATQEALETKANTSDLDPINNELETITRRVEKLEDTNSLFILFPLRTLQDRVYTQEEILSWFNVADIPTLKQKIVRNTPMFVKYGISLSSNPHYYKMVAEYVAFESANQLKLVFTGLNTSNDEPVKYQILINLDGTIISGNSNIERTLLPIGSKNEQLTLNLNNSPVFTYDGTTAQTGNLTINAETVPMSESDTTTLKQTLNNKADKADTLSGYGITNAYTKSESDAKFATIEQGQKADTALQPVAIADMLTKTEANTTYAKTSSLSTVATTGSYNDLTNKPATYTLPTASTEVLGGVKVDGTTITATPEGVITAVGGTSGTTDYSELSNKPRINAVELSGNKTAVDLKLFDSTTLLSGKNIQIKEVMTNGGIDTHTLACWHFDTSDLDVVSSFTFTTGGSLSSAFYKFGEKSWKRTTASFIGGAQKMYKNTPYTIDFWTYFTSGSGLTIDGSFQGFSPASLFVVTESEIRVLTNSSSAYQSVSKAVSSNTWHHFAYCYEPSGYKVTFFMDGEKVIDTPISFDSEYFNVVNFNGTGTYYLDELRISDMVRYDENFIPNTVAYTAGSSTNTYNINLDPTNLSKMVVVANKEALPEIVLSKYSFGFLTETSTLVFCDGTAWKQITLTDLA